MIDTPLVAGETACWEERVAYIMSVMVQSYCWVFAAVAALGASLVQAQLPRPVLEVPVGGQTNRPMRLEIHNVDELVYTIEAASTLPNWSTVAVSIGSVLYREHPLPIVDLRPLAAAQFYRVKAAERTAANDWKNQIFYPEDFFVTELTRFDQPEVRWVKFTLPFNEPHRVYFQDCRKTKFHYDFAVARLSQFKGMRPDQFDEVTLHRETRQAVLGALLYPPAPNDGEIGVQFVGQDPFTVDEIADWFQRVRAAVVAYQPIRLIYVPTYEQTASAEANRAELAARGIEVGSMAEWGTGANVYSAGWALGRLRYVPAGEIEAAYASGQLQPHDILLTDAIPAELPYLAGILSLNPATPNSHVAILAASYGVPFAWLATDELKAQAQSLVDRDVLVEASIYFGGTRLRLLDVSGVELAVRAQLAELKVPPPIQLTPKAHYGAYTAPTDGLHPADVKFFGGKVSNFGCLRREIPANSPPSLGISFDLWDEFMSQPLAGGGTLGAMIQERLSKYTYPPNVGNLTEDLDTIRKTITDATIFTDAQRQAIAAALLGKFDPKKNIRFRSSTNVEDTENFTGAGLYDSYSGCLEDDQDADENGPSICDPTEKNERGVFRAIRKVYASFYNLNAVLERLRHRVNEAEVGMGILVHYSNPDAEEMANGVATVRFTPSGASRDYEANLVTQLGAVSVTNPDGSAIPEIVQVLNFSSSRFTSDKQGSSLVQRGAHVMEFPKDYEAFAALFSKVAGGWEKDHAKLERYTLDFEFKKNLPGSLVVKQVRLLPDKEEVPDVRFLLNQPGEWDLFQGEFGSVFSNHRAKVRFGLAVKDLRLASSNLTATFYTTASLTFLEGLERREQAGQMSGFPEFRHTVSPPDFQGQEVVDAWGFQNSAIFQRATLQTLIRNPQSGDSPIVTTADLESYLTLGYRPGMTGYTESTQFGAITEDVVRLRRVPTSLAQGIPITRTVPAKTGASASISFLAPPPPTGVVAGYTSPLLAWKETRIEGLIERPIVLRGYYSQSYRPGHHNFWEEFLFEPRLEEGIDPEVLAQLAAKDIRQIYLVWDAGGDMHQASVIGGSGMLRKLSLP